MGKITVRKKKIVDIVLEYNPFSVFSRIDIDKYKRIQIVPFDSMFPHNEGICSCGCGQKLTGRRTRWASDECGTVAYWVYSIITGRLNFVRNCLIRKYGNKCVNCGSQEDLDVDHKLAVINGGGGMWLENYQLLCKKCHKEKTKKDLKIKKSRDYKSRLVDSS